MPSQSYKESKKFALERQNVIVKEIQNWKILGHERSLILATVVLVKKS